MNNMQTKFICPECNESFQIEDVEFQCSKHKYATMESPLFDFILGNTPRYCSECHREADFISHDSSCKGCSIEIINPDIVKKRICIISNSEDICTKFREKLITGFFPLNNGRETSDDVYIPFPEYFDYDNQGRKCVILYTFPADKFEELKEDTDDLKDWEQCIAKSDALVLLDDLSLSQKIFKDVSKHLGIVLNREKNIAKNIIKFPCIAEVSFGDGEKKENIIKHLINQFKSFAGLDSSIEILNWIMEIH